MYPENLDFTAAAKVLGVITGVAVLSTPLLWRALRRLRRPARVLLTTGGSVALTTLTGLAFEGWYPLKYESFTLAALIIAVVLQGLILPILIILSWKR